MININELRFSAAKSTRDLALLPSEVIELLDRLEAAEQELDALQAKIAEMERRPCATATKYDWYYAHGWNECLEAIKQKLACAKGE